MDADGGYGVPEASSTSSSPGTLFCAVTKWTPWPVIMKFLCRRPAMIRLPLVTCTTAGKIRETLIVSDAVRARALPEGGGISDASCLIEDPPGM